MVLFELAAYLDPITDMDWYDLLAEYSDRERIIAR